MAFFLLCTACMTYQQIRSQAVAALLFTGLINSHAESVTTGNLGMNIISGAGTYVWSPVLNAPFGTTNGSIVIEHNLWSDPVLNVHAIINGTDVGSFVVEIPPFFGSVTNVLDIGGLLVNGTNTIVFDGGGGSSAEYSINQVTLNFDVLPDPSDPPVTNVIAVSTAIVRPFSPATVFHYLLRAPLDAPEGSPVTGNVRWQFNEQKKSSLQKFDLDASKLQARSNYTLLAISSEETNEVTTAVSDKQGRLRISYQEQGQGKGHGKKAFPNELAPVTSLLGVGLMDGTNTVAWAWADDASKFQYLVKRNLSAADTNSGLMGAITLKANGEVVKFKAGAAGLTPGQPYHLVLNSVVAASLLADAEGRVGFVNWPAAAPFILNLRTVEVRDGSNNTVLGTVLP
jgi:hypothetical protein